MTVWREVSGREKALSCTTENSLNDCRVSGPRLGRLPALPTGQLRARAPTMAKLQRAGPGRDEAASQGHSLQESSSVEAPGGAKTPSPSTSAELSVVFQLSL